MEWSPEIERWAASALGESGLDFEVVRAMPWAVVARTETTAGTRWVKANHRTYAYEAALAEALGHLAPDVVVSVIARNPETGWFVMPDGGRPALASNAAAALAAYRRVQAATADCAADLLALGVPDMRPHRLTAVFDMAITDEDVAAIRSQLIDVRDAFGAICARLTADGHLTIVNTDMKLEHAFAGPPVRLFDWGDTVITHPLIGDATLRQHFDEQVGSELLDSGTSHLAADAAKLAPLLNAAVWLRDPPGARERWPDRVRWHLGELVRRLNTD